jgi:hypothetical protein
MGTRRPGCHLSNRPRHARSTHLAFERGAVPLAGIGGGYVGALQEGENGGIRVACGADDVIGQAPARAPEEAGASPATGTKKEECAALAAMQPTTGATWPKEGGFGAVGME